MYNITISFHIIQSNLCAISCNCDTFSGYLHACNCSTQSFKKISSSEVNFCREFEYVAESVTSCNLVLSIDLRTLNCLITYNNDNTTYLSLFFA